MIGNTAHLVGYLRPSADGAGFVLPVFRAEHANGLATQIIGEDGAVAGFRQIFPKDLCEASAHEPCSVQIGSPAIWGFADSNGVPAFEAREALAARLLPTIDRIDDPFLQLQLARFCEAEDKLSSAWAKAYDRLDQVSPRSARAWRDMVILPAAVRAAVAQTATSWGLEEEPAYWNEAVATQTLKGRLNLLLAPRLFLLFHNDRDALCDLEQRTASVRRAFGIDPGSLALREMPARAAPTGSPFLSQRAQERVIIALGQMANTLLQTAVLPTDPQPSFASVSRARHQYPLFEPVTILRGDELLDRTRLSQTVPRFDIGEPEELIITFQLSEDRAPLCDAACGLAEEYGAKGARVIAVIPHLPEPFFGSGQASSEIPPRIMSAFDTIWFLSDRSARMSQGHPFGPARSSTVAARHFRFMLHQGAPWSEDCMGASNSLRWQADVAVIGSAKGDRMIPTLLDHAMTRLINPAFDLASAEAALICVTSMLAPNPDQLAACAVRELPEADLQHQHIVRNDGGYDEVVVAVQGISTLPATPQNFEQLCAAQLQKAGWDVASSSLKAYDMEARRGDERLLVTCRFDFDEPAGGSYRGRIGRRWRNDTVLITTKALRGRQFMRHVLNGQTIIHYSRIAALASIHKRRYASVIEALRKNQLDVEREVIPACLNWLATQKEISDLLGVQVRVELSDPDTVDHGPTSDIHMFRLSLEVRPARSSDTIKSIHAIAQVALKEEGWRLMMLRSG
ncbi:hypothetical protein LL251_09165 [Sphingobium naphthae]|nr:hypothetical protein [Sphingobium naphthae]